MNPLVCPGCNGPKSKRAELCRECRKNANEVGSQLMQQLGSRATPTAPLPPRLRTSQQNIVYHGKISDLARRRLSENDDATKADLRRIEREVKRRTLAQAETMFARTIASSTELYEFEMEQLLEWLDDQIAAHEDDG